MLVFDILNERLTRLVLNKILESILRYLSAKLFRKILNVDSVLSKITGQNEGLLKLKLVVFFIDAFVLFVLARQ